MLWNYRIFIYESDKDKTEYISECYYDNNGKIDGYVSPENMRVYASDIHLYQEALTKPKLIICLDGKVVELKS